MESPTYVESEASSPLVMSIRTLETTVELIRDLQPDFNEIYAEVRKAGGRLQLPSPLVELLIKEELPSWCIFYEDEAKLKSLAVTLVIGLENIEEVEEGLKDASEDEIEQFKDEIYKNIIDSDLFGVSSGDYVDKLLEEPEKSWIDYSEAEQIKMQKELYIQLYATITQLNYYFSIMTFGRSICALVRDAKSGDDIALFSVIQIDKTTLTNITYFKQRLNRAYLEGDSIFLGKVATAISGKSLGSKMLYPKLMFVFAVLDDEGYLDIPLEKLMAVCEQLGVYGREFGIVDLDSLRKRRKQYRDKTGRQIKF